MEQNNFKLKAMVGNLDQKFNKMEQQFNTMLKLMMKEKGLQDNDVEASEPILPTPLAHLRLTTLADVPGFQHEPKGKLFIPNLPRIELQSFF